MQELEKILEEIEDHVKKFVVYGTSYDYISFRWVKQIIRKHMNDGWIPVEERLPEKFKEVLVCFEDDSPVIAYLDANMDWINSSTSIGIDIKISAWRPLPESYHPERSEGE